MITKFKITRLPERAIMKVNSIQVVLDAEYSIVDQSNMTIDVVGVGVPYDNFGFKLGSDSGTWSDQYSGTINKQVDTGIPTGTDLAITHARYEGILLDPHFVFDENTDRIEVVSLTPNSGTLYINGEEAIYGKEYMLYDFINVYFQHTDSSEAANEITTLSFIVGNKDGYQYPDGEFDVVLTASSNLYGTINGTSNVDTV